MSIPSGYKGPITLFWHLKYGGYLCAATGDENALPEEYIQLATIDVNVDFGSSHGVTEKAIAVLRDDIARERAESAMRIKGIEDSIQSLLAIEHKESV